MINYLNIYKFSFPFIKEKYEEVLFESIFSDFNELFIYEEILESIKREETENIKIIILFFKFWKIELLFNKNNDYYIPKFQLNLFFKDKVNNYLVTKIVNIIETFWLKNYIFDYDEFTLTNLKNYNIINIKYLENNFKLYNEKQLNNFLTKVNRDYLEEKLKENKIIFYSFIYLIYRCFIFYKNYTDLKNIKNDLHKLEWKNLNIEYLSIIKLSETRVDYLDDINFVTFKKYKKMLDQFFDLFY